VLRRKAPGIADRRARWHNRVANEQRSADVPGREVLIPTPDGTCDASLHTPPGTGPWPAVIMFPDAGGLRDTFRQMGQRLADLGYVVVVPNVYYRLGTIEPFDMRSVFADEGERKRLMSLLSTVTKADATSDTGAILDFLEQQPEVAGTKVGTTGYCMGGGLALNAAGRFPARVGAAASFHGGQIASSAPDSPHLLAGEMQATLYVAGAQHDGSFDDEQFARLSTALTTAGVEHTLVTYPAAHGFAVPDNPTYDEVAAERHWKALEELYAWALVS
jgi:carboxymethylenebutenolidase